MNGHIYFEIHADDLDRASRFYSNIFGWQIENAMEDIAIEYRRINTGGTQGGLLKRPAKIPPPQSGVNAYVCSVEVEDFDIITSKILEYGGQITLPKFAVPGVCWQGYFIDTEGNTFGIFQVDKEAK